MSKVRVDNLVKEFGDVTAINHTNRVFNDGIMTVLVGPSGCGKTTLMRTIAGLEKPTSGSVQIGDKYVTDVPPWDRNVAMIFQSYALYPHMSVYENIAFPLKARSVSGSDIDRRVKETANFLQITDLLDREPKELSGGQMQRVAVGRAVVRSPEVFLMDEPLSNLDAKLRVHMRAELKQLQRELEVTTIYVTHDQEEAMTLSDDLMVIDEGNVMQEGSPSEVYRNPDNTFVARFIGSPPMNLIECSCNHQDDTIRTQYFNYPLPDDLKPVIQKLPAENKFLLGVRPEDINVESEEKNKTIKTRLTLIEPQGKEVLLTLKVGDIELKCLTYPDTEIPEVGEDLWVSFSDLRLHFFDIDNGESY